MTNKYEQIEVLLEQFFEGRTSNVDEQQLYEFFAGYDVPEHLLRYKKVFVYFDIGLNSELLTEETTSKASDEAFDESDIAFAEDLEKELCVAEVPIRKMRHGKWILWAGVAASLLVLILLNLFGLGNKPFDPYEGSYIIRNGIRITDPEIIRPELEATIQQVTQQQQNAELLVAQLTTEDNEYTDVDKLIKEYYKSILEEYENEDVRNEVKKILEIE